MLFKTEIKVRGYHLDGYRHVNNARYLEFLEAARWDLTEVTGVDKGLIAEDLATVIANINISYRAAAFLGDILEVRSHFREVYPHKGTITQVIVNKKTGKTIAEAEVVYVIINLKAGKVAHLSPELLAQFERLVSAS